MRLVRHFAALIGLIALFAISTTSSWASDAVEARISALLEGADRAENAGNYDEALRRVEEVTALLSASSAMDAGRQERLGLISHRRAGLFLATGRNFEAEDAARTAMQLLSTTQGATPATGLAVGRLGDALRRQGQFGHASAYFEAFEKLTVSRREDPEVQWLLRHSAMNAAWTGAYEQAQARLGEIEAGAEPALKRQLAMDKLDVALMADDRDTAADLVGAIQADAELVAAFPAHFPFHHARFLRLSHEYSSAEAIMDDMVQRLESGVVGAPDGLVTGIYNLSGITKLGRGLTHEAKDRFLKALANLQARGIYEGLETANVLTGLASAALRSGELDRSIEWLETAVRAAEAALDPENEHVVQIRIELASAFLQNGDLQEAERALDLANGLLIDSGSPLARRIGAQSKIVEIDLMMKLGRDQDAVGLAETLIADVSAWDGADSGLLPTPLTMASELHGRLGAYSKALAAADRAIEIRSGYRAVGPSKMVDSKYWKARAQRGLGDREAALSTIGGAVELLGQYSTSMLDSRSALELDGELNRWRAVLELALELSHLEDGDAGELFQKSIQLAQASATEASMLNIRRFLAEEESGRGALLKRRNALFSDIGQLQEKAAAAPGLVDDERPAPEASEALSAKLRKLDEVNRAIEVAFPSAAFLSDIGFVSLDRVQSLLGDDEALVAAVPTESALYTLFVSQTDIRTVRHPTGEREIRDLVERIRAGLDLTGRIFQGDELTLDPADLFAVYSLVFRPFEEELSGIRHVLVIPSGALQSLPPHILLTEPVDRLTPENLRDAPWLTRKAAFSVLPSIRIFVVSRTQNYTPSAGDHLGVGDPILKGDATTDMRAIMPRADGGRSTLADPELLSRLMMPLPETTDEVQAVAEVFAKDGGTLLLNEFATEERIRTMDLSSFGTIHFATHGLLASETGYFGSGVLDPALVLTPPTSASTIDDGLLSAPEIARLDLNADLVILSACNTASPSGRANADGFSGLTKAFLSAGSQSVLVSHWAVGSEAAKVLVIDLSREMSGRNSRATAEALQRAMLKLISYEPYDALPFPAHPAIWGPFVVVGATAA